jgi:predicted kinase
MQTEKMLYMMLGYPGAGKTTAAEIVAQQTGAVHLSSDRQRLLLFPHPKFTEEEHKILYDTLDKKTEQLLNEGKSVIYDANLNRYQHRQEKYAIAERTGAKHLLLWVQTHKLIAKRRASDESRAKLWRHDEHPEQMFDRLVEIFEEPMSDEPYLALDGTKVSEAYIRELFSKRDE